MCVFLCMCVRVCICVCVYARMCVYVGELTIQIACIGGLLVNYPSIWPVIVMQASGDVIILESWGGGGQTFTTVLSALAVAK